MYKKFGNYNIVLLHKKVTNCITFYGYFYITFVLLFVTWAGPAYLLFNNNNNNKKTQKLYFWQL